MPDVKISGLPTGTVTGASTVPAVTSSTTHKTTVQASTAAGLAAYNTTIANNALSVGGATSAFTTIRATGSTSGQSAWYAYYADPTGAADVTTQRSYGSFPNTAAGSHTTTQITGYFAGGGTKGAGTTCQTAIGFFAHQTMVMADTVNYGFFGALPLDGIKNYNVFMSGTAHNFFAGRVGIGTQNPGSALEVVPGTLATQGINCLINGSASQVIYAVMAQAAGPAASNTGLYVNVNSATNTNFGIRIVSPPAGANNWSIYSDSPAHSYHVGNIAIGTPVGISQAATSPLDVGGNSIRIRTSSSPTSALSDGRAGEIRWDSGFLYVCTASGAAGAATWKRAALTAV